jgi:hypothetical protein
VQVADKEAPGSGSGLETVSRIMADTVTTVRRRVPWSLGFTR